MNISENITGRSARDSFQVLYEHLLGLLEQSSASNVSMKLEEGSLLISCFSSTAHELASETVTGFSSDLVSQWLTFLVDRVAYWPEADDPLFQVSNATKRILFASRKGFSIIADFQVHLKGGRNVNEIQFANITHAGGDWPTNSLFLSEQNERCLRDIVRATSGIVLTNASPKPHSIDGLAIALSLSPFASIYRHCSSEKTAVDVVEEAVTRPVLVAVKGEDPVEMIFHFSGLLSAKPELRTKVCDLLQGVVLHKRARRVCAACARSTPVDSRTIDKVPILLRPLVKSSYLFGRGCDACGHSAYRGTVGLSSILKIDDSFRGLLLQWSEGDIARKAYESGVRTLFEDGLDKIFAGLMSFEEVFSLTKNISSTFAAAIAVSREGGSINSALEGIHSSAFEKVSTVGKEDGGVSKRVLIVEDDFDQRSVLESVFRTEGFLVYGAENGQAALESLKQNKVDIVICDVMMPIMNGAQFIKELRSQMGLKEIPVLMLTAVSSPDAECRLLAHGADDYCEKNVKRKVLIARVEKLLKRQKKNPLQHFLNE